MSLKISKWIRVCIIIICSIGLLYSAFKLISIYREYKEVETEYENLQEYVEDSLDEEKIPFLSIDFENLKAINEDIVGWIYFENTEINYPIVKGKDNSYYLKHTFKKSENIAGSIFMDYENDSGFKDMHTILYGHNMKNESMFNILNKYSSKDFYDENPYFWLYTQESVYKCEIFSSYATKAVDSLSYNKKFSTTKEYDDFLKELKKSSIYDTSIDVNQDDIVLTLSTCTNNDKDNRFIVNSKMIKQ